MKTNPHVSRHPLPMTRRCFIGGTLAAPFTLPLAGAQGVSSVARQPLTGQVGITTGSFMQHLRADPQLHKTLLLDLPRRMREEYDLRIIDAMTGTFASFDHNYIDQLRDRADRHGCVFTNLKMNQTVNMASTEPAVRQEALRLYREMIDVAHRLGCRWVRPAIRGEKPDWKILVASYRELIDYAAPKGISLLVESIAGANRDPEAIPRFISAVGPGVAASPDFGLWPDETRYEGLKKAYPFAVTCDFKAMQLGPAGEHPAYDLKRCFQLGVEAGFRGPWCLEHFNETLDGLWRGFAHLSATLRAWIKELPANRR